MPRLGPKGVPAIVVVLLWMASFGAASASAATSVSYAVVPSFGNFVLIIGEADVDQIDVSRSGGTITITDRGPGGITTAAAQCSAVDPMTVTCPAADVREVDAVLMDGDDTFVGQNLDLITFVGPGDGADDVQTGPADDFIDDSLGNDVSRGGAGDDFLDGTSSNTDTGADVLDGGPGGDLVDYGGLPFGVQVTLADGLANDGLSGEGDNLVRVEDVEGTDFKDSLRGDAGSNDLIGGADDDVLVGLAGNDTLSGGNGDDMLTGGASPDGYRDRLACGLGSDVGVGQPEDHVLPDCERVGARVTGDSAKVRRGRARVRVECGATEVARCAVRVRLFSNGRRISRKKGARIPLGRVGKVRAKLNGFGRRKLRHSHGKLLVGALVDTKEPGGIATTKTQILLFGRPSR